MNVGILVAGMAYNPETEHLFVVDSATTSKVYVLDVANNYAPLGQFTIAGFAGGGAGMELDCEGNLWLANQSDDKAYQVQSGETANLCAGAGVPWLTEAPTTATIPPGGSVVVDVTLNSTTVPPGVYSAQLKFVTDTPYEVPNLPVKMTASIPPTLGKLAGIVSTNGYCDNEPDTLANVPVTINSAAFTQPLVLETDENGYYFVWLDQAASPLTVVVNAGVDYATGSVTGVTLIGGHTTIQDFTLRYLQPCLNATPPSLLVNIPLGTSTTKPLTLHNFGGATGVYNFTNTMTGYTPPAPLNVPDNLITIGDLTFSANPYPPTESTDPNSIFALKVNAGSTTITQSNSQTITSGNSVSCNAGGLHADNHYLRVFDLPTFGITRAFGITNVSFGIEQSVPAGATQPVEVRLFTLNGAFQFANLTPIGSADRSRDEPGTDDSQRACDRHCPCRLQAGGRYLHPERPDCGQ